MYAAALAAALAFWHSPPPCHVRFEVAPLRAGVAGQTNMRRCVVVIDRRNWRRCWRDTVAAHEYGHLLHGPQHSTNPRSIMYFRLGRAQVRAYVRRVGSCP